MNKAELIEAVATKAKLTKSGAEEAVNATLCAIEGSLKKGGDVRIAGFGSFSVKKKAAHKGINPKTRKPMTIKASKTVRFKASKTLKEKL